MIEVGQIWEVIQLNAPGWLGANGSKVGDKLLITKLVFDDIAPTLVVGVYCQSVGHHPIYWDPARLYVLARQVEDPVAAKL